MVHPGDSDSSDSEQVEDEEEDLRDVRVGSWKKYSGDGRANFEMKQHYNVDARGADLKNDCVSIVRVKVQRIQIVAGED